MPSREFDWLKSPPTSTAVALGVAPSGRGGAAATATVADSANSPARAHERRTRTVPVSPMSTLAHHQKSLSAAPDSLAAAVESAFWARSYGVATGVQVGVPVPAAVARAGGVRPPGAA